MTDVEAAGFIPQMMNVEAAGFNPRIGESRT